MGKEVKGPKPTFEIVKNISVQPNKSYIQWIIAQQWTYNQPALYQISEDGQIIVIIKSGVSASCHVLNGFKFYGNKYGSLLKILREKKLIPRNLNNMEFYLKNGIEWTKSNEVTDTFTSGSKILIIIKLKRLKAISKRK